MSKIIGKSVGLHLIDFVKSSNRINNILMPSRRIGNGKGVYLSVDEPF
jgi:hypothetical protein